MEYIIQYMQHIDIGNYWKKCMRLLILHNIIFPANCLKTSTKDLKIALTIFHSFHVDPKNRYHSLFQTW